MSTSTYPIVRSSLKIGGPQHAENTKKWQPVLERFSAALGEASSEGKKSALTRHTSRGQILARDRISLLLDPDSPFLEIGPFTGHNLPDSTPCASMIGGIGLIHDRPCLVLSHIPTQSGGAWNEYTVLKVDRLMEIAAENDLPVVSLVQSAGVFLPYQFKVFHKGGRLFRELSVRTSKRQASCAVVFGSCTAGGAYHPALSDYSIFVKDQAQVFLGGPPLVKMATGEVIGAEELGGAKVHAQVTGLADQMAEDEFDAVRKARDWVASLDLRSTEFRSLSAALPPRYSIDDIFSFIDPDIRKAFDMREVLIRIVDDSRLLNFKPEFGRNLITAWASIFGHRVGIIANQTPVINADEAMKGATFIKMCNQENVPIIFLQNVTGFMVGSKAEHSAIIKFGAQMVSAVSTSKVPHISLIMGASYGAGNYAMCGRSFKPRFLFTWPIGRCSVMGPDQLAGVMRQVQKGSAESQGRDVNEADLDASTKKFRDEVERDSESYATSAVLHDDGIIDPRDTREVLGLCLEVVRVPGVEGEPGHRTLARI
ncbi:carboxyl transferase [Paraphoma chrysanthemicola]|uniref:methylcrotonoyl-CoA carboxylase n=1 Tax=Paraphoma chrysanthemicola TaxID=798071 RepID=A0A8K0QV75_9PLEO|nr:carboxyl transferase [Paraphoma chrysanthemicola]